MSDFIRKIQEADDFAALGSVTDKDIANAENNLNLVFADDYKEYLRAFGVATFYSKELTGIGPSARLNVVNVTMHARDVYKNFPTDAYVVEDLLFDHVLTIQKQDGSIYSYGPKDSEEKIAASLADYLFPEG